MVLSSFDQFGQVPSSLPFQISYVNIAEFTSNIYEKFHLLIYVLFENKIQNDKDGGPMWTEMYWIEILFVITGGFEPRSTLK